MIDETNSPNKTAETRYDSQYSAHSQLPNLSVGMRKKNVSEATGKSVKLDNCQPANPNAIPIEEYNK